MLWTQGVRPCAWVKGFWRKYTSQLESHKYKYSLNIVSELNPEGENSSKDEAPVTDLWHVYRTETNRNTRKECFIFN